ncbi:MAG: neutral zinc metallopeptidase [Planctomycetota bacterium]
MRLDGHEQSRNVEDRRGQKGPIAFGGGSLLVILVVIVVKLLGGSAETQQVVTQIARKAAEAQASRQPAPVGEGVDDAAKVFVSQILKSTENVWTEIFREQVDGSYAPPKLILFQDSVTSGCGNASAAMGPFYCPADERVYLDPHFFTELAERHRADGDFAQAYVIAHEVAHHVQNLVGYSDRVNEVRQRGDELMSNQMSVRLELQADYLAGVWAHYAQRDYNILEEGDIEEGINAANRIGDDTLQREATGYVRPERFTHGTSAQRARWFKKGLQTGEFAACDQLFKIAYEKL